MHLGPTVLDSTRLVGRTLVRQIRFPSFSRCLIESSMLAAVFLAAGHVSLGHGIAEMLAPMAAVVLVMMLCFVASGVYRTEIIHSIMNLYVHSAYGFLLAAIAFLLTVAWLEPAYADGRFAFFFLFSAFFVTNTVRPLICGTDFMDGGGRRGN